MKAKVKKEPSIVSKFQEYHIPLSAIENISISFVPLDVSAKTKNKKIYLNQNMLKPDSEVNDPTKYLIHETIHAIQQITGNTQGHEKPEYLDKDTEIEAFKTQMDYTKRNEGKEEAEEYVDDLLSYHGLMGSKRKEKEKELLGK
jgi:hypothetical protein